MHVSKIARKKGISERNEKTQVLEWNETSLELTLTENDSPEEANELANMLLDAWLKKTEKK